MVKVSKQYNAIILDFVKTLVTEDLDWNTLREENVKIFDRYGINIKAQDLKPVISQTASQLNFLKNLKYSSEVILEVEKEILQAQDRFEKKFLSLFNLFEDTVPFINYANKHNLKIGILTDNLASTVTQVFLRLKVPFQGQIVGREDVKYTKPNLEGIVELLKRLDANPDKSFYIGDSDFDIDLAKRMNILAIHIKRNADFKLSYETPDQTINSLLDITLD